MVDQFLPSMQQGLFGGWQALDLPDAEAKVWQDWLTPGEQAKLLRACETLAWEQSTLTIAGRQLPIPRLNCWYGDPGCHYAYSGIKLPLNSWIPELEWAKSLVEAATGAAFNSLLANLYRDGNDSVDWHADDEPELGRDPLIAMISLGDVREFSLKHRTQKNLPSLKLALAPGSLLVMGRNVQKRWLHRVPKTKKPVSCRISLTFRQVIN